MPEPVDTGPPPQEIIPAAEIMPLGQRLFDNIHLLLGLGILIMVVLYTGWGLWEILTMPKATLP